MDCHEFPISWPRFSKHLGQEKALAKARVEDLAKARGKALGKAQERAQDQG